MKAIILFLATLFLVVPRLAGAAPDVDMNEMLDASTLDVRVLEDWRRVDGDDRSGTRSQTANSFPLTEREYHRGVGAFRPGEVAETGRIWWMFVRGPDGSAAYLRDIFPDGQWSDINWDDSNQAWTTEIKIKEGGAQIDLFSNHCKMITSHSVEYPTYISCPYTRVILKCHESP